jgi:hypothetical protein
MECCASNNESVAKYSVIELTELPSIKAPQLPEIEYHFITNNALPSTAILPPCPLLKKFFVVSDEEIITSNSTAPLEDPILSLGFVKGRCIRRQ